MGFILISIINKTNLAYCQNPEHTNIIEILVKVPIKMGNQPEFLSQTLHLQVFLLQREQRSH